MTFERILGKLRDLGRPWAAGSEPVEIHRAILEDVEAQTVAVSGGRRVFPFDRVEITLLALTPEETARLEAIAEAAWDLHREIPERLKAAGASHPADLTVTVKVTSDDGPAFAGRRYAVTCRRQSAGATTDPTAAGAVVGAATVASPATAANLAGEGDGSNEGAKMQQAAGDPSEAPTERLPLGPAAGRERQGSEPEVAAPSPQAREVAAPDPAGREAPSPVPARGRAGAPVRPRLRVTVLKGTAGRGAYDLDADRIYLGRLDEVLDAAGRVKRRNDVAFAEEGDLNQTVSREHARIAWDADTGAFRLRDENSASGTLLFRAGRSIEVSRHDRRGVRLESGDEIYLGRAAVRIALG